MDFIQLGGSSRVDEMILARVRSGFAGEKSDTFSIHNDDMDILPVVPKFFPSKQHCGRRPYALSWKPCQGDSLNLPDHRIHKDGDGDASFQLKSNSLPHAHAQTTKTFYKHQDSRIMKAQELKDKDFRTNSDIQDLPSKISSLSREINRISYEISTRSDADLRRLVSFDVFFRKARGVERLQELQGGVRVAREDDRGVTEGREDVREVFQQRRSGAKRKLSRCGRNQMGNEPILALPEGAGMWFTVIWARNWRRVRLEEFRSDELSIWKIGLGGDESLSKPEFAWIL
ncbi:hypothetical protein Tco_0705541 [Tanacetum coccineum]|uniref:Uncharacterized protein n=1 Tax=Tanacetum coccineum TaxID=301880 RepID=A0ABQ4Y6T9_9ASTR